MKTKQEHNHRNTSSRSQRKTRVQNILGIDVGGTGIKVAPVDVQKGQLLQKRIRVRTPRPATPAKVAEIVREFTQLFNWEGPIGCGMPCLINGEVIQSGNLSKRWEGQNPGQLLREKTRLPVTILNDADAAGLAEMRFGAGKQCRRTVLMVTIGTGIGTSLFREGKLVPNIEVGGLIKAATKRASDRARQKDELSWKRWAKRLNRCLGLLEASLSPDLIIIGGGVSKKYDKFGKYLKTRARIVPAVYRGDAGILGAALAASNKDLLRPSSTSKMANS